MIYSVILNRPPVVTDRRSVIRVCERHNNVEMRISGYHAGISSDTPFWKNLLYHYVGNSERKRRVSSDLWGGRDIPEVVFGDHTYTIVFHRQKSTNMRYHSSRSSCH